MASILKYASLEDVISAIELVHEHETTDKVYSNIFGLDNALTFINYGCIKNTDHVLVMTYYYELITWIISYIYVPNKLVANTLYSHSNTDINKWNDFQLLLSGYHYTDPFFSSIEIDCNEGGNVQYDVAIVGLLLPDNTMSEKTISRFYLETGDEYELFERCLIGNSKNLKDNGILIMLTKPGWLLKAWNLLEDLNLQLEYNNYQLYVDNNRDPNTYVWLRFVKSRNMKIPLHKSNIMNLMRDNSIDRLYAHRNNLLFPYIELPDYHNEAYIGLEQDAEYMQYFFTVQTTMNLSKLCNGYTACLVTPSVARYAHKEGKNIILFERDNRFRENGGLKFVKYDLYKGLTKLLYNKYLNKFDSLICDPPFNIKLDVLSNDITELLKHEKSSIAYIVFPSKQKACLVNAMKMKGMHLLDDPDVISIEYAKPPKIVRLYGREAIQIYKFSYLI